MRTPRLLLRGWRQTDLHSFARLNADPEVMEHFLHALTQEQSDALVRRIEAEFAERGHGLWALEEHATGRFIGFTGLSVSSFDAPFMPAIEVGWRLARAYWGRGYATEAAQAALAFGFREVGLAEIVSLTSAVNLRSQRVMQHLEMTHDPADDFDHPSVSEGHRLRPHVLYRLTAAHWHAAR